MSLVEAEAETEGEAETVVLEGKELDALLVAGVVLVVVVVVMVVVEDVVVLVAEVVVLSKGANLVIEGR